MPPSIAEVYLDFDWDRAQVWALDLPTTAIATHELGWHLDLPFWSTVRGEARFDLCPRAVLDDPSVSPRHAERIAGCDLSYPLDVMAHRGRTCVMDGLHRLARWTQLGATEVPIRQVLRAALTAEPLH